MKEFADQQHGVAIRGGARHGFGGDPGAGARAILDDECGLMHASDLIGEQAADGVGRSLDIIARALSWLLRTAPM